MAVTVIFHSNLTFKGCFNNLSKDKILFILNPPFDIFDLFYSVFKCIKIQQENFTRNDTGQLFTN